MTVSAGFGGGTTAANGPYDAFMPTLTCRDLVQFVTKSPSSYQIEKVGPQRETKPRGKGVFGDAAQFPKSSPGKESDFGHQITQRVCRITLAKFM